jgi:hypothetical protein
LELHKASGQESVAVDDEDFLADVIAVCGVEPALGTRLTNYFTARANGLDKHAAIHRVGTGAAGGGKTERYEHWWNFYQERSTKGVPS